MKLMTDHQEKARELLAIVEKATPGPWFWRLSSSGRIDLSAPHGGGTTVMDFARKGLQGAQPRFAICFDGQPRGKRGGIMQTAVEIMEDNNGLLRNDDAEAIAALPDLATELRALADENLALRAEVERLKVPKLLDDTSLRAKIGGIGNEIHNLGCSHQGNDEIARVTADLAGRLWGLAKQCSAEPASAFTGRITGRNRADIPSDAGVPPREPYSKEWCMNMANKSLAAETDSRCNYLMTAGHICNKCGRVHDGGGAFASAFTGRITGRNRADIPTDAGVPSRDQWAGYGEGWSVGAWPDEQRIDTIAANGPTGAHYEHAILHGSAFVANGRIVPPEELYLSGTDGAGLRGDAQDGSE